ncbi:hypothetical protein CVT24_012063 [Panaeolus cyanescens]|uniref:G domain-containing protein n=1 Tax=Panaeolus cyanescens TaxID=181874 RepID=A0A409VI00_9AGAR|nr:hypothetical protein CVT24_012063 [Panaeolus cyanescens]
MFDFSDLSYLFIRQEEYEDHTASGSLTGKLLSVSQKSLKHLVIDLSGYIHLTYEPPKDFLSTTGERMYNTLDPGPLFLHVPIDIETELFPQLTILEVIWSPNSDVDVFNEIRTMLEDDFFSFMPSLQSVALDIYLDPDTQYCTTDANYWTSFISCLCSVDNAPHLENIIVKVTHAHDATALELLHTFQDIETGLLERGIDGISFNGVVGVLGSGKTTFIRHLSNELASLRFQRSSFEDDVTPKQDPITFIRVHDPSKPRWGNRIVYGRIKPAALGIIYLHPVAQSNLTGTLSPVGRCYIHNLLLLGAKSKTVDLDRLVFVTTMWDEHRRGEDIDARTKEFVESVKAMKRPHQLPKFENTKSSAWTILEGLLQAVEHSAAVSDHDERSFVSQSSFFKSFRQHVHL